jgi:hypothetical protein
MISNCFLKVKRPVGRPKKNKESASLTEDASSATSRAHYTGDDLINIARMVVDVNPYIAPYGKKGIAWQQVIDKLVEQNFRHKTINTVTVQHKADALVSYKKVRVRMIFPFLVVLIVFTRTRTAKTRIWLVSLAMALRPASLSVHFSSAWRRSTMSPRTRVMKLRRS